MDLENNLPGRPLGPGKPGSPFEPGPPGNPPKSKYIINIIL